MFVLWRLDIGGFLCVFVQFGNEQCGGNIGVLGIGVDLDVIVAGWWIGLVEQWVQWFVVVIIIVILVVVWIVYNQCCVLVGVDIDEQVLVVGCIIE